MVQMRTAKNLINAPHCESTQRSPAAPQSFVLSFVLSLQHDRTPSHAVPSDWSTSSLCPPPRHPPFSSYLVPSQHAGPSLKALSIVRSWLPTQSQLVSLNRELLHHKSLLYDFSEHLLLHKTNFPI